jgi:fatty acid desaturase
MVDQATRLQQAAPLQTAIRELQVKSTWRYVVAYGSDAAIIFGVYLCVGLWQHWLLYVPAVLVLGSRQHAIGILGHDGAHGLISRNKRLNRILSEMCTWPLLVNVHDGYKEWHMDHHRHLGTARDPEHYGYRRLPAYVLPVSRARVVRLFILDLFGLGLHEVLMFVRVVFPRHAVNFIGPILLWLSAFGVAYWFDMLWVPVLWLVALITGFWAVFRVRTWAEHVGKTAGPGKEASHRYHIGALGRFLFFPHNVWYHYEHHVYASVPFFNLPKLRELLRERPVIAFGEVFDNMQTSAVPQDERVVVA